MNYSLQTRKFINSEHMGKNLQLELPLGKNQSSVSFKIHYTDEGTGEPIVLVHSAGQSLYTWHAVKDELSQHFRVIAVDLMGHGYSDASSYCTYSIEEQATVLGLFLSKLGIKSSHFLAFSMGCAVVASFAASNPKRVGRIIFMSPGGVTPEMPTVIRMMESRLLGSISSMLLNPSTVRSMLSECFLDLTQITEEMVSQYSQPLMDSDTKRAVRLMVYSYDEDATLKALSQIDAPVHILIALDDKWRTADSIQPYFDVLKNGTSSVIRNAGHLLHEEKPEKVLAAISAFINPQPSQSEEDAAPDSSDNANTAE